MASRVVALLLALVTACSTSHSADPTGDGGAEVDVREAGDWTELTFWSRLPGVTATVEGVPVRLGAFEVAVSIPAIRGTTTTLELAGGGATLDLPADWSRDYEVLHLPDDEALEHMDFLIVRRGDNGSCGVSMTNGGAGGYVWAGDGADPITACGPFGLVLFRRDRGAGPCPPGADCGGFEEITGDGTLRIDPFFGDPGAPTVETTLTDDDLMRVRVALTEPALMDLLAGNRPCPPITDTFERMRLEWLLESAENETSACDAPELVAVRELLDELTARYAPP